VKGRAWSGFPYLQVIKLKKIKERNLKKEKMMVCSDVMVVLGRNMVGFREKQKGYC